MEEKLKGVEVNVFDFSPNTFTQFSNYNIQENYEVDKKFSMSSFGEISSIIHAQKRQRSSFMEEEPGNAQLGKQFM